MYRRIGCGVSEGPGAVSCNYGKPRLDPPKPGFMPFFTWSGKRACGRRSEVGGQRSEVGDRGSGIGGRKEAAQPGMGIAHKAALNTLGERTSLRASSTNANVLDTCSTLTKSPLAIISVTKRQYSVDVITFGRAGPPQKDKLPKKKL